ncbi:MAG: hypothetical protein S4CHLAM102_10260 [Chlamydiia bacterium]|nr:hypothetical protein [Chlamydiia bacterium]
MRVLGKPCSWAKSGVSCAMSLWGVPSSSAIKDKLHSATFATPHQFVQDLASFLEQLTQQPNLPPEDLSLLKSLLNHFFDSQSSLLSPSLNAREPNVEPFRVILAGEQDPSPEQIANAARLARAIADEETGIFLAFTQGINQYFQSQMSDAPPILTQALGLVCPLLSYPVSQEATTSLSDWLGQLDRQELANQLYGTQTEQLNPLQAKEFGQLLKLFFDLDQAASQPTQISRVHVIALDLSTLLQQLIRDRTGMCGRLKEELSTYLQQSFRQEKELLRNLKHALISRYPDLTSIQEQIRIARLFPYHFLWTGTWRRDEEQIMDQITALQSPDQLKELASDLHACIERYHNGSEQGQVLHLMEKLANRLFDQRDGLIHQMRLQIQEEVATALTGQEHPLLSAIANSICQFTDAVKAKCSSTTRKATALLNAQLQELEKEQETVFGSHPPRHIADTLKQFNLCFVKVSALTRQTPRATRQEVMGEFVCVVEQLDVDIQQAIKGQKGLIPQAVDAIAANVQRATDAVFERHGITRPASESIEVEESDTGSSTLSFAPSRSTTGHLDWMITGLRSLPKILAGQVMGYSIDSITYLLKKAAKVIDQSGNPPRDLTEAQSAIREANGIMARLDRNHTSPAQLISALQEIRSKFTNIRILVNSIVELPSFAVTPPQDRSQVDALTARLNAMGIGQNAERNAEVNPQILNEKEERLRSTASLYLTHMCATTILGTTSQSSQERFSSLMRGSESRSLEEKETLFIKNYARLVDENPNYNLFGKSIIRYGLPIIYTVVKFAIDHFGKGLFLSILEAADEVRGSRIKPFNTVPIQRTAQFMAAFRDAQEAYGTDDIPSGIQKREFLQMRLAEGRYLRGHSRSSLYSELTTRLVQNSIPKINLSYPIDELIEICEGWYYDIQENVASFVTLIALPVAAPIYGTLFVLQAITRAVEWAMHNMLCWLTSMTLNWSGLPLYMIDKCSENLFDPSDFSYAIDRVLEESLGLLCDFLIKEIPAEELPVLRNTDFVREKTRELIKSLQEALGFIDKDTPHETRSYSQSLNGSSVENRMLFALQNRAMPGILDVVITLLLTGYHAFIQEDAIEHLLSILLDSLNETLENRDVELTEEDHLQFEAQRRGQDQNIERLIDLLIWTSIKQGLNESLSDLGQSKKQTFEATIRWVQRRLLDNEDEAEQSTGLLTQLKENLAELPGKPLDQRIEILDQCHRMLGRFYQEYREKKHQISAEFGVSSGLEKELGELMRKMNNQEERFFNRFKVLHDRHRWARVQQLAGEQLAPTPNTLQDLEDNYTQLMGLLDGPLDDFPALEMERLEKDLSTLTELTHMLGNLSSLPNELASFQGELHSHTLLYSNKIQALKSALHFRQKANELKGKIDVVVQRKRDSLQLPQVPFDVWELIPHRDPVHEAEKEATTLLALLLPPERTPQDEKARSALLASLTADIKQITHLDRMDSVNALSDKMKEKIDRYLTATHRSAQQFSRSMSDKVRQLKQDCEKIDELRDLGFRATTGNEPYKQTVSECTRLLVDTQQAVRELKGPIYVNAEMFNTDPILMFVHQLAFLGCKDVLKRLNQMIRHNPAVVRGLIDYNVGIETTERGRLRV